MVQPQIQRRGTGTCGAFLCPRARREPSLNGHSLGVGPGCCQQWPLGTGTSPWYVAPVTFLAVLCIQSWSILHHPGPLVASSIVVVLDSVPLSLALCLSLSLALALCLSLSLSLSLSLPRSFSLIPNPLRLCGFHLLLLFLPSIPWVPLNSRYLSL